MSQLIYIAFLIWAVLLIAGTVLSVIGDAIFNQLKRIADQLERKEPK